MRPLVFLACSLLRYGSSLRGGRWGSSSSRCSELGSALLVAARDVHPEAQEVVYELLEGTEVLNTACTDSQEQVLNLGHRSQRAECLLGLLRVSEEIPYIRDGPIDLGDVVEKFGRFWSNRDNCALSCHLNHYLWLFGALT